VELRVEALARYAKRQNPDDPISFLENILFQTIEEIKMAGKITSVSEGGRSTQFTFYRGEHPGELVMMAIHYLEAIKETGIAPQKVHTTDFSQIQI
jgi:hypothetical protein